MKRPDELRRENEAVRNLPGYVRSRGFSSDLMRSKTFQGMPMRHRGVAVGHFFLAGKDGGREFTSEDAEVLVVFAARAGAAALRTRPGAAPRPGGR